MLHLNNLINIHKFIVVLFLFGLSRLFRLLPFFPFTRLLVLINRYCRTMDWDRRGSISRSQLIELSLKNMNAKKTRTWITVGGMTIGIATIVFLVSIGYGLQSLVITRVARLDEMSQTDVSPQASNKIKINDQTVSQLTGISQVSSVLPLISVVGKVTYQKSAIDMAVYGVTADYLRQSAVKPIRGRIFNNTSISLSPKDLSSPASDQSSVSEYGELLQSLRHVQITIKPDQWIKVRKSPDIKSNIVGYTPAQKTSFPGEEIWGGDYDDAFQLGKSGYTRDNVLLGKWLKATVPLWTKDGNRYLAQRDTAGNQITATGYFSEINLSLTEADRQPILGLTSDLPSGWVEIASESATPDSLEIKTINLQNTSHEAVVNRALLRVLGLDETSALDTVFDVSFIVTGSLLDTEKQRIESQPLSYRIIGLIPDDKTPMFYVPFTDLRSLGLTNFSQLKVTVGQPSDLASVRQQIESMGYQTSSVSDTVVQIKNLFSTARLLLALLGMVALSVASLGMFNTLTVSLLERTREVGLLKAMGMKSFEIRDLFLAESMIMGTLGGFFGLLLGFITGKLLELILSGFAVYRGVGALSLVYLPPVFILTIITISLLVGLLTGLYPSNRATKISALNALRYE